MTANIYFEEFPLELIIDNTAHSFGYLSGEFEIDEDGDIEEIWIRTRTRDGDDNLIRLDPDRRSEPFEFELAKRLREEVSEKYKFIIDEAVDDIRQSRRATAADHRNDMMWGV